MKRPKLARKPRRVRGPNPLVTGHIVREFSSTMRFTGGSPFPAASNPMADTRTFAEMIQQNYSRRIEESAFDPIFSDVVTTTADGRELARDLLPNWDPKWEPRRAFRGICFGLGSFGMVDVET